MHSTIDINQTGSFPDRSGSGHDMSFSGFPSGMSTIPDIVIPNNGIKQPSLTTSQYGQGQGGVGLFDNVEFTCTVRATYLPTYSGADQVLIGADGYIILAAIAGTDLMAHTPYTLSKVQTTTALKFLPFRHTFYSVRRRANGVIRFGVNDQFQDVAAPLPPMVYTRFSYGRSLSFGGLVQWPGQIADGSAWSSFLSDADIARYYKLTLGLL
jgi:hypothetical protein